MDCVAGYEANAGWLHRMITDPLVQGGGGLPGWRFQSSLRPLPNDLKERPVQAEVERGFAAHAARATTERRREILAWTGQG